MTTLIEPLSASFAATSLVVLAIRHRHVRVVVGATAAAAMVSVAATIQLVRTGHPGWAGATALEIAALSVPIMLLLRTAPLSRGVVWCCALAGLAQSAVILRYVDHTLVMSLASMVLGSLPAAGAAGGGLYLRALDARRRRAVTDAARAQRIALASDLHDFVAHDLTGVVVQAQAALTIAERDPRQAIGSLERIEASGLRALESIDGALELLREHRLDPRTLAELVHGFRVPGGTRVRVAADSSALDRLDARSASVAHRFALEALTNVRRHSPEAERVDVEIADEPQAVRLSVTSDIAGRRRIRRAAAGTGLTHLAQRVAAVGGRLTAGPIDGERWRVTAELPVAR